MQLYFKQFPLRSTPYAKEAGLGLLAAQDLGRFWPLARRTWEQADEFSPAAFSNWAEEAGIEREELATRMADPELKRRLVASKREGLENGVDSTPSFFINGRRYKGELEVAELVDVLLEVHE